MIRRAIRSRMCGATRKTSYRRGAGAELASLLNLGNVRTAADSLLDSTGRDWSRLDSTGLYWSLSTLPNCQRASAAQDVASEPNKDPGGVSSVFAPSIMQRLLDWARLTPARDLGLHMDYPIA